MIEVSICVLAMCNGIGYRAGSLSFGNDFAKNVVIFGVDNSLINSS